MVKEILVNRKTAWFSWEIIIHTYNIYQDYFVSYEKDVTGQIFHNRWELSFDKSKGLLNKEEE